MRVKVVGEVVEEKWGMAQEVSFGPVFVQSLLFPI